jgi:hypothetical protein
MPQNDQDRRRANRVKFEMRAPLSTDSGRRELIEDSWTIDISALGVRLRLRGQVVPGQIVIVFLNQHPEQCRVVWTNQTGGTKQLIAGLEFTRPLPDE